MFLRHIMSRKSCRGRYGFKALTVSSKGSGASIRFSIFRLSIFRSLYPSAPENLWLFLSLQGLGLLMAPWETWLWLGKSIGMSKWTNKSHLRPTSCGHSMGAQKWTGHMAMPTSYKIESLSLCDTVTAVSIFRSAIQRRKKKRWTEGQRQRTGRTLLMVRNDSIGKRLKSLGQMLWCNTAEKQT